VYYKRGDIVLAHFGYNVGHELGGIHYAVVVERDNNLSSGIVMVVPLSSLESGKTRNDLHKSEVFLGAIVGDVECYAMPLQMRTISKLRIIKPKHTSHGKFTIPGKLLDLIDEKILENFIKK
jgi:mRNA-degrading endonuclease toxin of MazEF toxin-antitoxin module